MRATCDAVTSRIGPRVSRRRRLEMPLLPDRIRLAQPRRDLSVDVGRDRQSKVMHVIARRDCFDPPKALVLEPPWEHDVPVDPPRARRHLRERHPHLEGDSRLLRQHRDRPTGLDRTNERVEEPADLWRLSTKVCVELVARARVRLVAVRELAAATCTTP